MLDRRRKSDPVLNECRLPVGERRAAPRYGTRGTPAVIGWSEGNEYRTIDAWLIDISMGGFSAWVETFPPRGVPVWLRLDGENPSPWLKASVIATVKSGCFFWARRRIRLQFLDACPYDFFKGAIHGFTREVDCRDAMFEGENKRHWR